MAFRALVIQRHFVRHSLPLFRPPARRLCVLERAAHRVLPVAVDLEHLGLRAGLGLGLLGHKRIVTRLVESVGWYGSGRAVGEPSGACAGERVWVSRERARGW